jgi:DNA polymerase I
VSENFSQVVVADSEYECDAGDLPNVLCMVADVLDENLQHVRTIRLWRGEFGRTPPFDIGPDTLFVAYSAWAEMTCFKVLGWQFPVHIFDLHTAYLAATNVLLPYDPNEARKKPRKRLPDACRAYGLEGWERIDKETIAEDIGGGRWQKYGRDVVLNYCAEDVGMSVRLLRRMIVGHATFPPADVPRVLHWSNYSAKAIALIQAHGIPIDTDLWNLVQEHKGAVIKELLRQFDPSHSDAEQIYTPEGEWSYDRFERFLIRRNVHAWPRLESGRLDIDSDAFRSMYHVPGIEALHALRDSLGFIAKARLPIGRDGRNRPSLYPFARSAAGTRTAKVRTMLMLACAGLLGSHPTRSAFTATGARRKSASPQAIRAISH